MNTILDLVYSFFVQMSFTETLVYTILCFGGPAGYTCYRLAMKNPEHRRTMLYLRLAWTGFKALVLQKCESWREKICPQADMLTDEQIDLYNHNSMSSIKNNALLKDDAYPVMKPANLEELME